MSSPHASRAALEASLDRINSIDQSGFTLNSVLALSQTARQEADAYDATNANLPLAGMPILIKDNIEAIGLPATAGSLALANTPVSRDATLVTRLKAAGGIIVGSTNLSEWANIRSAQSTSGWSGVSGLTANPWKHSQSAGGSSAGSGAAVAAGLTRFAIGSETDGSITCPASLNGCVGIKPTVGSIPRDGMIPVSGSQDSPGPMAQSVSDVALLLEVLTHRQGLVKASSEPGRLRIGIAESWLTQDAATNALFESAVNTLAGSGALLVNVLLAELAEEIREDEFQILLHELVSDLGEYLTSRPGTRVKSLADVVEFNIAHAGEEMHHFGQDLFEKALLLGGRGEEYRVKRERNLSWATSTLDHALDGLDVVIGCTYGPAWTSTLGFGDDYSSASWMTAAPSIAGTPIGTLPMGLVNGLPVGLGVISRANEEATLIRAMSQIEKSLNIGILTPTFVKE